MNNIATLIRFPRATLRHWPFIIQVTNAPGQSAAVQLNIVLNVTKNSRAYYFEEDSTAEVAIQLFFKKPL